MPTNASVKSVFKSVRLLRLFRTLVIAPVLLFTTSAFAQNATKVAEDFGNKWVATYNAGDAKGIASLFTKDGTWSPATAALLKGHDQIEKAVAARMKAGFTKQTVTMEAAHQNGDTIWAEGEYSIIGSGDNSGKKIAGRFGAVYVREGNDWHLAMLTGNGGLK